MKTDKISRRRFLGQASCAAVGSLSVLNTLLHLRLAGSLAAATPPEDGEYRALVCVFLAGGNDSFNMLVPREPGAYSDYANSRADLALTADQLIEIRPQGLPAFGVHHGMPELAALFDQGVAAFVANVGTLIEPVANRKQVEQSLKRLPLGLYSHSDQVEQWQSGVPHSRSGIGWAGRMADLIKELNRDQTVPMNVSIAGSNVWQTGTTGAEYAITPSGAVALAQYNPTFDAGSGDAFRQAISAAVDSQLALHYSNLLQKTFQDRKRLAVDASALFAGATAAPLPAGVTFPTTSLGQQLAMVARTIQGRQALGAVRQTFFVSLGGWDHHDEVLVNQGAMLPHVSAAVGAFYQALAAMGVDKQVTLFSASDFGRTLTSNGRGSDHAWGGNQFIVGGAVNGRRIYGQYPALTINPESGAEVNPLDTGRGRFIPTTSVDELFAELALWLGVRKTDLPLVLPNIGNFYSASSSAAPLGFLLANEA